jgi:membrane protease YdiL (CAAX protease family)
MLRALADPKLRSRTVIALALAFFTWQMLNGFIRPLQVDAPLWFWVTDVAFSAVLPGLLLALAYDGVPSFALPAKVWHGVLALWRLLGWWLVGCLIAFLAFYANWTVPKAEWAVARFSAFDYGWVMPYPDDNPIQFKLALVYLSLSAGVFEEWFYRHFLDRRLTPFIAAWPLRVCATSVLFGLVHWESGVYAVCNAAALGLVFALLIRATGKLAPAIVAHFTVDMFLLP